MRKNKEGKKIENKERVPMKNLIDEEETTETEIEKEINVVDAMMIKADMTQAVTGITVTYAIKLLSDEILISYCKLFVEIQDTGVEADQETNTTDIEMMTTDVMLEIKVNKEYTIAKFELFKKYISHSGNRDHRSSSHHNRRRHRSRSRSHK